MKDFIEPRPLGNGLFWTARYKGHDWARKFSFYFLVEISNEAGATVNQFSIETFDYGYGDQTSSYSDAETLELVRSELERWAKRGEANTNAIF
jgi:hypothetical protein